MRTVILRSNFLRFIGEPKALTLPFPEFITCQYRYAIIAGDTALILE